ncbi:MAG: Tol-Pal system beta propeller repeat protein TolB [Acidithiobacillus sp.]
MKEPNLHGLLMVVLLALPLSANALTVNISKAVNPLAPVAVPSFGSGPADQPSIAAIVRNDLRHSGYFSVIPPAQYPDDPHSADAVHLSEWAKTGALAMAVGKVQENPEGFVVDADVISLISHKMVAGRRYISKLQGYHMLGQQVADLVYQQITGYPGPFASPIAFVDQQSSHYDLEVAQSDGWDAKTILRGKIPVISPAWSPQAHTLAYVSYLHRHSVIYLQNLATGQRHQIPDGGTALSAPAFSPNGQYLAFAKVWKRGRTELVRENLRTGHERVLTRVGTVNTSPTWSPSGNQLVFVSNRQGSAQIFAMDADGQHVRRLSFSGGYNVSPDYAADGHWITFIHAYRGVLAVAVMRPSGGDVQVLYDGGNCEHPSFAHDGRMIVFATHRAGQKVLGEVAINGKGLHFLTVKGEANEPAWAPA